MKKILMVLMTLGCIYVSEAQVDRRIGNSQYKNSLPDRKEKKDDPIEKSLNYLDKELKLDVFQKAAIKTLLEDNQDVNSKIMASNISEGEKMLKLDEARENLNQNIAAVLNPKQIENFDRIKDNDRKNNKESRKKIKEKRKKKEDKE